MKRELAPTPDRLSATVRATICAVIITLIGEAASSQDLFVALFIVLSLPRDYPKQTLKASLSIAGAVIVSGVLALFLQAIAADIPWARVLVIFASIFFSMLIGRKLNQGLIGVLLSILTAQTMLAYDSTSNSEAATEGTLWFVLMFTFGVATATAVEYLFPHATPLQSFTDGMEQRLQAAGAVMKNLSGASLTDAERKQAGRIDRLTATGVAPLRQKLVSALSAGELRVQDLARFNSLLPFLELLAVLAARLNPYKAGDFDEGQRKFAFRSSERVFELVERVKAPQGTTEASTGRDSAPADDRGTSANFDADRESVVLRSSSRDRKPENVVWEERSEAMQAQLLTETGEVLDSLWSAWYLESEFGAKTYQVKAQPAKKSSLAPQPFFARDSVHFALKVALASIICYIIFNAVDWPGISTALVTCFIVAVDTVGATYRKLALRLGGVVIGGLLFGIGGIALVLSQMDNVVELLLYVALVFFVSGWVVNGSQRISYAGVQITLAFALVAMSSPTIPDQITEARDRFVGVLLGAIVMWFVFGHLWPMSAIAAQKAKLADLIQDLADLFELSAAEGPIAERITRFYELRKSANQAILAAYDQADVSGFDSRRNLQLQRSLRDCLAKAQALLMLEVVAVSLSLEQAMDKVAANTDRKRMTEDNASLLRQIAEEVKTGNEEQLAAAARHLAELLTKWDQSLIHEHAPEQARIVQQRHAHIIDLLGRVHDF